MDKKEDIFYVLQSTYFTDYRHIPPNLYANGYNIEKMEFNVSQNYGTNDIKVIINEESRISLVTTANNCSLVLIQDMENVDERLFNILFKSCLFTLAISDKNLFNESINIGEGLWAYRLKGNPVWKSRSSLNYPYSCELKVSENNELKLNVRSTGRCNYVEIFGYRFLYWLSYYFTDSEIPGREFLVTYSERSKWVSPKYRVALKYRAVRTYSALRLLIKDSEEGT